MKIALSRSFLLEWIRSHSRFQIVRFSHRRKPWETAFQS